LIEKIFMNRIAVFTSGGDAPGMNAHIRAVVRTAIANNIEPYGVIGGYSGMIEGDFRKLERKDTANIISLGGTILKTSRSAEFMHPGGRKAAAKNLKELHIDGIVACGGDGTFHGAHALWEEYGIPIVGTPGTIDNDIYGTDYTIGYDTAINTCAQAIDKLRDTADSHGRVFIVEVMGRHAGFIAMDVGVSCGAEFVAVPETVTDTDELYERILAQGKQKRTIVIVGEGDELGGATDLSQILKDKYAIDSKVTILGHIQRGGSPTVRDRVLASSLGMAAVEALMAGRSDVMVGETYSQISYTPLVDTWTNQKPLMNNLLKMSDMLA
jgi:6-phosphofructokinase 1